MTNIETMREHGGWMVEVKTADLTLRTFIVRNFYVYEPDRDKAVQVATDVIPVVAGETARAVKSLNIHELTGYGLKPGDVKQYV